MNLYNVKEYLPYAIKNRTDGFMATTLEPYESGLPMYIVFNCYGGGYEWLKPRFLIPRKHKKMIVEVAKEKEIDRRCSRFYWDELIPVEVSETPRISLNGKKRRSAQLVFTSEEWNQLFEYIKQNLTAIERHWLGVTDSCGLFDELIP